MLTCLGLSVLLLDSLHCAQLRDSSQRCGWLCSLQPRRKILTILQLLVCLGVSLVISAINFGSDVAFNAVVGVSNAALCFSYIVSVGCLRIKRFRDETLLPARWSLGRWGALINDISLVFLIVIFIFSFFPTDPSRGDPDWVAKFNWAIVLFGATCLLASGYYAVKGRHTYVAPVSLVKMD